MSGKPADERAAEAMNALAEKARESEDKGVMYVLIVMTEDERGLAMSHAHNFCCPKHINMALSEFVRDIEFTHQHGEVH